MRALIVDADSDARLQVSKLLDECGFDSVGAADGVDALRSMSDFAIDLIVAEISLPRLDVVQLIHIIRNGAFGPTPPPMIICSARLHEASWAIHPALQGLTLLAKPVTPRAFATALDAALPVECLD
ncbi:MAG: response regulator [Hyphomonadaceae bacterium]|nr:response regulator [Hyphomonadaceae bacterium]